MGHPYLASIASPAEGRSVLPDNADSWQTAEDPSLSSQDRVRSLQERFVVCCQWFLQSGSPSDPAWAAARQHLSARAFAASRFCKLPIGFFPGAEALRLGLIKAGFTREEIQESSLLADSRLPGRLLGPIRDPDGRPVSFWARACDQPGARHLYLHRDWRRHTPLFGLDVALAGVAAQGGDMIVVEDFLDAIWLHDHGVQHVAAVGGPARCAGQECWKWLAGFGIRRVRLVTRGAWPAGLYPPTGDTARRLAMPEVVVRPMPASLAGIGLSEWVHSVGVRAFLAWLGEADRTPPPPRSAVRAQTVGDWCALHGCHRMDCFCWD